MDRYQSFEDKDESIWIPDVVIMQPIIKLEWIKLQYRLSGNIG